MESEIVLVKSSFLTKRVFNMRLRIENHWLNVRVVIKKQFTKPFIERIISAS